MKKKTSLWISGITTVAMLAVAVGSFAAWDKLTADPVTINATSGSPAILKVETTGTPETNKKLVPEGSIVSIENNEATEVGLGDVEIKLEEDIASNPADKSKYATFTGKASVETTDASGTEQISHFDVILTPSTGSAITLDGTAKDVPAGKYSVKLKYNDATTYDDAQTLKGKSLNVELTFDATAKTATPGA